MKRFLEEYGLITCSAIVIMMFLGFSYMFGDTFKQNTGKTIEAIAGEKVILQQKESLLLRGWEFNDLLAANVEQAKVVHFTKGLKAPVNAKIVDFSEAKDGSILGWLDGDVYYINSDNVIKTHEKVGNMFSGYDYDRMWLRLQSVESIIFDNFDTSNTVDFHNMFVDSNVKELNVSSFNTRKATDISYMFYNCEKLTSLDLSSFNTQNVTNMSYMFFNCKNLKTLNISSFNTINAISLKGMFGRCASLRTINLKHFDTRNVEDFSSMFELCTFDHLDLSNFNTAKATSMYGMFESLHVPSLDLSMFDTSLVENMAHMFHCSRIPNLNIKGFDTRNVKSFYCMFGYTEYTTLNLDHFDTSNAVYMYEMFSRCLNLQSLSMKNANTSKVSDFKEMFKECNVLKNIDMNFNFSNAKTTEKMFYSCRSLNANITINKVPNNYMNMFGFSAESPSKIIVNYTKNVESEIDKIIATKGTHHNFVEKGSLVM